jgi:hypothetical protein
LERSSLEQLFGALERHRARYLVAGGLAVLAHGFVRVTLDVDLVLDLTPPHPGPALEAFRELGLQPLVPVRLEEFADPAARESWVREKAARVFQLWSEAHRTLRVDLFLEPPFAFQSAWNRRHRAPIAAGLEVSFVALDDLLAMKRAAGRPQDLADIDRLEKLRRASREDG